MHFYLKCYSGHIALQWFLIKHYSDYQYKKIQLYTSQVQKFCVFERYTTSVPQLLMCSVYANFSFGIIVLQVKKANIAFLIFFLLVYASCL